MSADPRIEETGRVGVYRFPTPGPESDGTLSWDATTAVTVEIDAGDRRGLGWSYTSPAAAAILTHHLLPLLSGRDPFDLPDIRADLHRACRNIGTAAVVAHALSAVDIALWDLKARLLGTPLSRLFGAARPATPVYGSGGFTDLSDTALADQITSWLAAGCRLVKIKIGQDRGTAVERDLHRVEQAAALLDGRARLMVDANGGYTTGAARRVGAELDRLGVIWFEEPVTSDDPDGLALIRSSVRADVAAGEYIYRRYDAARLAGAVDCLQLDLTRCGGYSGFLDCAALAAARGLPVSAHCAPALHAPVAAAVPELRHVEWFIDHARLEPLLVEGACEVRDGLLPAHSGRPGHGMTLAATAARYRVSAPA